MQEMVELHRFYMRDNASRDEMMSIGKTTRRRTEVRKPLAEAD
jgi:hypothetical protein